MGHRVTTLNVNTIEPAGNTLTIGASGDSVVLADDVKANTYKDAGGNTLFVSNGSGVLSSVNTGFGDSLKLLSTTTVSSAVANISFTSGIDSTYKEYIFKFITLHPATDGQELKFQVNASGQTGFNETMTTTFFDGDVTEGGSNSLNYEAADDQAQGTAYQKLTRGTGNENDECCSGQLHLFNPASTTYVKHFICRMAEYMSSPRILDNFIAGYINTTSAVNAVRFQISGNAMDDGTINMYGIK